MLSSQWIVLLIVHMHIRVGFYHIHLLRGNQISYYSHYQYIMSKNKAIKSLLSQNYSLFLLTIECFGVSIYHTDSGSYKIFDCRSRGECCISQPLCACVLLKVLSIESLAQCFQAIINTHSVTIMNSEECRLVHMK